LQAISSGVEELSKEREVKQNYIDELGNRIENSNKNLVEKKEEIKSAETKKVEISDKIEERRRLEKEVEKANIFLRSKNENLVNLQKELNEIESSLSEEDDSFDEDVLLKIKEKTIIIP
jgi:chromosome segregation ATPase